MRVNISNNLKTFGGVIAEKNYGIKTFLFFSGAAFVRNGAF